MWLDEIHSLNRAELFITQYQWSNISENLIGLSIYLFLESVNGVLDSHLLLLELAQSNSFFSNKKNI